MVPGAALVHTINAVTSPPFFNLLFLAESVEADVRGVSYEGWNAITHRGSRGLGHEGVILRQRRAVANKTKLTAD